MTLHGSQVTDFHNKSLRLSFFSEKFVHTGMQNIHLFTSCITEAPRFFGKQTCVFSYLNEREKNINNVIERSKVESKEFDHSKKMSVYRENFLCNAALSAIFRKQNQVDVVINTLTTSIQALWRGYSQRKL